MYKKEALERFDEIQRRLRLADNPIRDYATSEAVGNLIIAIDQISEIVRAMIPDEIVAAQQGHEARPATLAEHLQELVDKHADEIYKLE